MRKDSFNKKYKLKRLDRQLVSEGSVFRFYRDKMQLPDGKIEYWDYVDHKKTGGAAVVPVLSDGRILLIRQYRPAVDRETLELPAGARNTPDEDAKVTAARELKEETGFSSDHLTKLLHLDTATSWCGETTDVFLAENCARESAQKLDEAEEIGLEVLTLKDALDMIYGGELTDSKTVAGLLAYANLKCEREDSF